MIHYAAVWAEHLFGFNTACNRVAEIPSRAMCGIAAPIRVGHDVVLMTENKI
jgi:hypothetical protein